MQRRDLLKIVAVSAAASGAGCNSAPRTGAELKFLEPEQERLVDRLSEMIIPTDERSLGASAADVSLFIDQQLADGPDEDRAAWNDGLAAVEREARSRFDSAFLDCTMSQQDEILADMALHEDSPQTDLQRFFADLKARTVTGYYTSPIGLLEELEYKGIMPIAEFPGCDHPEHQG